MVIKLVLGNIDYIAHPGGGMGHVTNEGDQLQTGLVHVGWQIAGRGLSIDSIDVRQILDQLKPQVVFVQDYRDWDRNNRGGCFDPSVCFEGIEALADHSEIFKATVVKDAGSMIGYQHNFAKKINANAIVIYYHEQSVTGHSPWLNEYQLIRTYHSVDADVCRDICLTNSRRKGLISGALNPYVYPLRQMVHDNAERLGLSVQGHPGYNNKGCHTNEYLRMLSTYRVHVATASTYGFALRKIIESVAMGCAPITDLPVYDVLPEIDEALVRVPQKCSLDTIAAAINKADREWDLNRAVHFSKLAQAWYDYRAIGQRLSEKITEAASRSMVA